LTYVRIVTFAAALLLVPLLARAQDSTPPKAAAAEPAAAPDGSKFTLDEVGGRAEDVAAQLRAMTEKVSDQAVLAELESDVFQFSHRVSDRWKETDQLLAQSLRRAPLETLASSWRALRTELKGLETLVDARATRRAGDLATLDRLKQLWVWTLDHANAVSAPEPVIGRVQATLSAIDATRAQVEARNSRLLVLQDAVSRAIQACDDAGARIADAREKSVARIFVQSVPPVWRLLGAQSTSETMAVLIARRSGDIASIADSMRIYTQAYGMGFAISLAVAFLMLWTLYRARLAEPHAPVSSHAALPEFVTQVLRTPIATAILLTLFITRPLRPDQPAALQQLLYLIGLPVSLIVIRRVLDPRLLRAFVGVVAFFVVDIARGILQLSPGIEQIVLIVEMAAATGVLYRIAALLPTATGTLVATSLWIRTVGRWVMRASALATAFASLAAVLGYVELADFVGGGALLLIYLSVGVMALRVAASGTVWLALVKSPLARLRAIKDNYTTLGASIDWALGYVTIALWFVLALQRFELFRPVVSAIEAVLDARLQAGEVNASVGHVLSFVAVVVGAWLTSRVVVFMLEEDVYPRMNLARGIPYALSALVRYGLLLAGFFAALAMLGVDLTHLTVLVSAFGLGLGFGMQQIINNFVSGLILLFERPVQVGDLVETKDLNGEVLRIGIRASRIRTSDGADVIIPNSELIQNGVTNWTLSDRKRRVSLEIGVAYGTPAEQVLELLLGVAASDARVLADPAPEALFTGFGASALAFQLRFWTEESKWMQLKSDLGVALQHALREARIRMAITPVEVQMEPVSAREPAPTNR
jgi:small-conductance mechanosensitive channel